MPIPRDKKHLYQTPEARAANEAARARAGGRCECRGQCGHDHTHRDAADRITTRCPELNGQRALFQRGFVVLTVAHLDHHPENNDAANLAVLCQACHLRHDAKQHARTRAKNRDKRAGQGRLFE